MNNELNIIIIVVNNRSALNITVVLQAIKLISNLKMLKNQNILNQLNSLLQML